MVSIACTLPGKVRQQPGELSERLWRIQLVEIINHHRDLGVGVGELRQHPVERRRCIEVRRRRRRFRAAGRWRSVADRVEQGQPELLGVVLVALHLQHGKPTPLARRSAHARSSQVFPLPAGAEMIVTFRADARSRAASRSPRSISQGVA